MLDSQTSTLNFETPPEDKILTPEKLAELATKDCEKGEIFLGNMGQFIRLQELEDNIWYVPIELIIPNPDQPRNYFDEKKLNEMEVSMLDRGQENAAAVVPYIDSEGKIKFLIEGGERRFRVITERIGAQYMKVEIKWRPTYKELYVAAGLDNLDREDPNPIEQAKFFNRLIEWEMEADGIGKAKATNTISKKTGRKETFIKNRLKLLETSEIIQTAIIEGLPAHIGIEVARMAKRGDNQLAAELKAVQILLDNPEKDYDSEAARIKDLSKLTVGEAQEVMKAILASTGGKAGEETVARVDAAKKIIGFSSALTTIINQSRRLVANPKLIPTIIATMQERRGYPPDIVFDRIQTVLPIIRGIHRQIVETATDTEIPMKPDDLRAELEEGRSALDEMIEDLAVPTRGYPTEIIKTRAQEAFARLKEVYEKIVVTAMIPPPLEIPEGAPTFFEQLKKQGANLAQKSALKFRIAKILADASDNDEKSLNSKEIADKLKEQGISTKETVIEQIIRDLDSDLMRMDLRVDVQVLRIRDKKTNKLQKVNTYRLKWVIKR